MIRLADLVRALRPSALSAAASWTTTSGPLRREPAADGPGSLDAAAAAHGRWLDRRRGLTHRIRLLDRRTDGAAARLLLQVKAHGAGGNPVEASIHELHLAASPSGWEVVRLVETLQWRLEDRRGGHAAALAA